MSNREEKQFAIPLFDDDEKSSKDDATKEKKTEEGRIIFIIL